MFLGRVIFYGLLLLIVLLSTPYGIVSPWRGAAEAVFECGVFLLTVLWMVDGMLSRAWVSRKHLLLLPFLLLAAFAYAQTISYGPAQYPAGLSAPIWQAISFDPYETRLMVWKLLSYGLALGLLLRYTSSHTRVRALILTVIGIGVASALFAILRQTTQRGAPEFLFPSVLLDRGYGQFVNRNHFALLMEMALGLILGLVTAGGARRERALLYLAAAIPVWVALVLSTSRGGILTMLCQLLLLALMFSLARKRERKQESDLQPYSRLTRIGGSTLLRLTLGACLLAATIVGIVWVGGEQTVSRFESIQNEISAEAQEAIMGVRRKEIWEATWQMIKDHPVTGVGFGGYWAAITRYHKASGRMTPQQAHNDYLELLASGGVIGVLLVGWSFFLLLRFTRERLRSPDSFMRASSLGAAIGLFGVGIHSLVDFGLHIPINAAICLVLVAIAIGDVSREAETPWLAERLV
jgi:O-antigen ligase